MARATEHLAGRGQSSKRRDSNGRAAFSGARGSPNDWIPPESDTRIDLVSPAWNAVTSVLSAAASFAAARPAVSAIAASATLLALARVAHLRGPHTDIPFRQYLRFQVIAIWLYDL